PVLAIAPEGVFLGHKSHIYFLDKRAGSVQHVYTAPDTLLYWTSLSYDGSFLWGAGAGQDRSALARIQTSSLQKRDALPQAARFVDLDGPGIIARLAPGIHAVADIEQPYTVRLFDRTLAPMAQITPAGWWPIVREPDAATRIVTMAMLPVSCGGLLQVLTDLRSSRRWLVLYRVDAEEFQQLRVRELNGPFGLVQTL